MKICDLLQRSQEEINDGAKNILLICYDQKSVKIIILLT